MPNQLRDFFKKNETRIGDHYNPELPHYYDSLRHGVDFFFRTFRSNNSSYHYYAFSFLAGYYNETIEETELREINFVNREFTDDDNILLSLVSIQRFFELFLKSVLLEVDSRLVSKISNPNDFIQILIASENFTPKYRVEAGEALTRVSLLFGNTDRAVEDAFPKLAATRDRLNFLGEPTHIETIKLLNEWRNKLLHGGSTFPNLRAFDFFWSNRLIPLIRKILKSEETLSKSNASFYLTTISAIDLLKEIEEVNLEIHEIDRLPLERETSLKLIKLGHLKELGRANMKMNLFLRSNQASYEYNYKDPLGRGVRFAESEKSCKDFVSIKECPCCSKSSLVLYEIVTDSIIEIGKKTHIQWVTCYTCTYHLRMNVGDPFLLGLSKERVFTYPEE